MSTHLHAHTDTATKAHTAHTHTFQATEVTHPKYDGYNHLSAFSTAVSQHASKKTLPVTVPFSL